MQIVMNAVIRFDFKFLRENKFSLHHLIINLENNDPTLTILIFRICLLLFKRCTFQLHGKFSQMLAHYRLFKIYVFN